MKAIQTKYKGYTFRSRLEARWAIFFDTLKIKWTYENEGYELKDGTWYLPVFEIWLNDYRYFCEVKPEGDEFVKARKFGNEEGVSIILLDGVPDFKLYFVSFYNNKDKCGDCRACVICHNKKFSNYLYTEPEFGFAIAKTRDELACFGDNYHDAVDAARKGNF